jgi:hypothetical protein
MAYPPITEKLRAELNQPVTTEIQAAYIFVEIRKLLEQTTQKAAYPGLNFYGNWVVHTKLSASPIADEIVRLCDEHLYRQCNNTVDVALANKADEFFNERLLREELRTFLQISGLPIDICTDSSRWYRFRKTLAGVIEDVPLELRPSKDANPTHFVESVTVKNKSTDEALNVEWQMNMHTQPEIRVKDGIMSLIGRHPLTDK